MYRNLLNISLTAGPQEALSEVYTAGYPCLHVRVENAIM